MVWINKIIEKNGYLLLIEFQGKEKITLEVDTYALIKHFVESGSKRMAILLEDYSKFKTIRVNEEKTLEFPDFLLNITDFDGKPQKVPLDLNPNDIYNISYKPEERDFVCTQLKINRILNNYTQKELSEKAKVSLRTLQEIEQGRKNPSIPTLQKIISALNLKLVFARSV